jgi:transcriptional regulator with XRE-family HTH domain
MQEPATFDAWDCALPELPRRSRLYPLEPIGIGTSFVESLAGYVMRLADAHAVSVGDLVGRELWADASKRSLSSWPFRRQNRAKSHGFHACAHAINGFGESSKRWVDALERATLRTNLRLLTLLPFEGVFSCPAVFRRTRAWCSACYEDSQTCGTAVYEHLLWTIGLATMCPRHRRPLEVECPHCRWRLTPLSVYSRPGYCSRCQRWLGCKTKGWQEHPPRYDQETTNAGMPYDEVIGELLAVASRLNSSSLRQVFRANLRACVDAVAGGNQLVFARAAHVSHTAVSCHLTGKTRPSIGTFLRICCHLGIPATVFLESDPACGVAQWKSAKERVQKSRGLRASRTSEQVRLVLERGVREQPPPRLSEIAHQLGYKCEWSLYLVHGDLCKQITANYRRSGRSHWWRKPGAGRICEPSKIKELLGRSLAQEEPLSVHHLAARLGYVNDGYIRLRFPDLCRAVGQKIAAQKESRLALVERTLETALLENPVPKLSELCKRLGYAHSDTFRTRFPVLCDQILARRRALREQRIFELRKALQASLLEWPAPSFATVCKRTGLSRASLLELCPDESKAIQSRYWPARKEASQHRREQLVAEVREIVRKLHRQGTRPTPERVTALLGKTTLREWKALNAAVRAARQEFDQEYPSLRGSEVL